MKTTTIILSFLVSYICFGQTGKEIAVMIDELPSPIDMKNERRTVIINPGNSLWRIAARGYGSGFRYTEIYKANLDQIRDPALIYPGQVFKLPALAQYESDDKGRKNHVFKCVSHSDCSRRLAVHSSIWNSNAHPIYFLYSFRLDWRNFDALVHLFF